MLDKVTREDFVPRVGETFRVEEAGVDLVLAEAVDLSVRGGSPGPRRAPFSLLFRGPKQPVLPQRIWALANEAIGGIDIFLVAIGPDADGVRYEAVFN
ncbi:MAG: hypothetical protein PT977_12685 [Acidobacteriota bacterium]|nr:hypothetical protein [Acidobacteriota bacterium]